MVAGAYARWSFASGPERALRFAAYTATLDQEQKTASPTAARAPITGADCPGDARRLQTGRPRRLMAFAGAALELGLHELRS